MKQTQADGTVYQFAYTLDGAGKVTQTDVTDPRGNIRRVTFNGAGYPLTDTRAYGTALVQTTTYERQATTNLPTAITDALGRRTESTYDTMGNVLTVTRLAGTADAVTTTVTYTSTFNQVASVTDPLSHTTSLGYDSAGNLSTITDPLGHQTTLTYNAAGQPLTITTPAGTTQLGYDQGDLATITDPTGKTTTRFTDGGGRPISVTTPLGQRTRYAYDPLNQLTTITDPLGGTTQFSYDGNGNLVSLTDARSSVTGYTYNSMDRATTRTDPLTHAETYTYDNNGNQTSATDRKSQVTQTPYDVLDRPTQATYQDGSTTTYTWDAGNRLTQLVDSLASTITRSYDGLDRLTQEGTPQGTVSYAYDPAGRRTSMTVLGQPTVNYNYDATDRLTQITQGSATVTFAYDMANRRTGLTLPNGVVTGYTYDATSRLTGLTYSLGATVLGTLTYSYDANGNRTVMGGTWAATGLPQPVASATYDAANRQVTFGGLTLSYDLNGNLTSDGTNTYTWDARNQLVGMNGASVTASFSYDPLGRRQGKTINSAATQFLYDGLTPVQELTGAAVGANLLTGLGIDEYFTRTDTTGASHFLADALGSTLALTDATGSIPTTYTYEPFGATTITGATTGNSFAYTGRENDGTGLYYYRARYYHPALQRFISEDPIGFAGGDVNLYGYVFNRPTAFGDSSGLAVDPISWTAAGIMCGGGALAGATILAGRKATLNDRLYYAGVGCATGTLLLVSWIAAGGAAVAGTIASWSLPAELGTGYGIDIASLKLTDTVAQGLASRPYLHSPLTIRQIIQSRPPIPDPGGVPGALRWDAPGAVQGTAGVWELVVDTRTNTILHFVFKRTK
jgi:RHS repeat-associated protein